VGNYIAVLLQIYYSICLPKIISKYYAVWQVIPRIKGCNFLPHSVHVHTHRIKYTWQLNKNTKILFLKVSTAVSTQDCYVGQRSCFDGLILRQDSAPANTARVTSVDWLKSNWSNFIVKDERPSNSCDLNSVDYQAGGQCWSLTISCSHKRKQFPTWKMHCNWSDLPCRRN